VFDLILDGCSAAIDPGSVAGGLGTTVSAATRETRRESEVGFRVRRPSLTAGSVRWVKTG